MYKKVNILFMSSIFLMTLFLFTSCINDDEPDGGNISINDTLPQFAVVMNNGETVNTQSFLGKIGIIMFFNTNCQDCRKELPVIQQLWDIYNEDDDLKIVAISREEGEDEILEYWNENSLNLPFSPQNNRDVYSLFAKSIIPRIYISNQEGKVIFMSGDEDMPTLDMLVETIETLLIQN